MSDSHENLDPRWQPYFEKKVVLVVKATEHQKRRTLTGIVKHYGSWKHASILVKGRCYDTDFDNVEKIKLWESKPTLLKSADLKVGRWYRSHRPRRPVMSPYYDDRKILWLGFDSLQYDSVTVSNGRHFPTMKIDQFLQWAAKDVTDEINAEIAKEEQEDAARAKQSA